jgi:ribosomal protein L34E
MKLLFGCVIHHEFSNQRGRFEEDRDSENDSWSVNQLLGGFLEEQMKKPRKPRCSRCRRPLSATDLAVHDGALEASAQLGERPEPRLCSQCVGKDLAESHEDQLVDDAERGKLAR